LANNTSTPSASLTAAGSTFDQPLFSRQFYYYNQANHGVSVNYAAVGSGTGESDILAGTVNFGASDVPEPVGTTTSTGGAILQVPVVLGGVAVAYNLPGTGSGLHLTGQQIASIYAGNTTNWSQIPGSGSTSPIITVHRSDSSGTSNAFTSYMNSVDPGDWPSSLVGKSPSWPSGNGAVGGNGNAGVAGDVQNTPNSIGYVELAYALQSGLTYANVQNAAGSFVQPTLGSVTAAANAFPNVSAGSPLIVNPPASAGSAYPISTYSWAIVTQKQANTNNGIALGKLLDWMVTTGQGQASAIGYAPLPSNVTSLAVSTILQMQTATGAPLFTP
jgi:phosphate transport system substrate-binding protein